MDIYSLLMDPDDDGAQAKAQALSQALRRQQAIGTLAALTGDKVLGQVGQQFSQSASQGQERLGQAGETRLRRTMEKQRFAADDAHRQKQLGLQEQQIGEQGRHNKALEGLNQAQLAAKAAADAAAAEAKKKEDTAKAAGGLRDDLLKNPATKAMQDVATAYQKVQAAADMAVRDPSAAGPADIALVFGLMKVLDPGSRVTADESANAENAGGVPDYIRSQWNALRGGGKLGAATRENFRRVAEQAFNAQREGYSKLAGEFGRLAKEQGVPESSVVLDLGFSQPAAAAAAPVPGYDQMKPGTIYVGPDGKKRRKGG